MLGSACVPECPFRALLLQSNTQVHPPLATKWVAVAYFSVHGEAWATASPPCPSAASSKKMFVGAAYLSLLLITGPPPTSRTHSFNPKPSPLPPRGPLLGSLKACAHRPTQLGAFRATANVPLPSPPSSTLRPFFSRPPSDPLISLPPPRPLPPMTLKTHPPIA